MLNCDLQAKAKPSAEEKSTAPSGLQAAQEKVSRKAPGSQLSDNTQYAVELLPTKSGAH